MIYKIINRNTPTEKNKLSVICPNLVIDTLSLSVYTHEAFIILYCYLNCGLT